MTATGPPPVPGIPVTARMLVVIKPDYRALFLHSNGTRPRWVLPGGLVHPSESPAQAAIREVQEETGLYLTAGPLLLMQWVPARTPGRRGRLALTFAGPTLDASQADRIVLQRNEVDAHAWYDPEQARPLLHPELIQYVGYGIGLPARPAYIETHTEMTA